MESDLIIERLKTEIRQVIEETNKKEFKKIEEEFKKVALAINDNAKRIEGLELINKHCI